MKGFSGHLAGGGPLFDRVGQPDGIRDLEFDGSCREQQMSCRPFGPAALRSLVRYGYEALLDDTGRVVRERRDPEAGFAKAPPGELSTWDDLNLAWYIGYAMWNYLSVPFIWSWPGVETQTLSPVVDGERRMRRLRVKYPHGVATHSEEEIFYFTDEGLIARVDYAPTVTGGRLAANFASEYLRVPGGLVVPMRRVVRSRTSEGALITAPIIDIRISRLAYA